MSTIRTVSELVLWDANNQVLRLADGTPDVNAKNPAAKYFRLRWNVAGVTSPYQLLIGTDRASIARAAHRELLEARDAGTTVGDDGWPVTGQRPQTGRVKRHALVTGATPAFRSAPVSTHPHSGLGFLEYFDEVYVPYAKNTVKGNTTGQYRSFAVAIDRELVRVTGAGTMRITVAEATTEDVAAALAAAASTGGNSRRRQIYIVAGLLFQLAATNSPKLRADNPMVGVKQITPKKPKVNLLDGRNRVQPAPQPAPTFRNARQKVDFWDVVDLIFPGLHEFYLGHGWMRLASGPRPCELSEFTADKIHLDEGYAIADGSLTLQTPKYNGGQRLMLSGLKARTVNDERIIPIPDIPECRAALQAAIDSAPERAAKRREFLLSGKGRPRSPHVDPDAWLRSELMFTENPRIFTTESGAPFDPTNFEKHWKKAVHAAFPDADDPRRALRFYDLREISGDMMKSAGVSVAETSLLLGHSERVHRQNYTERRIGEVTRTAQQMTEHITATRDGEPAPLAAVIDFPASA